MEKYIALSVKCPHCSKSLMNPYFTIQNKPSVKLEIKHGDESGIVNLCSFYGCVDHSASIEIKENEVYQFFCPHCHEELISNVSCEECKSSMVPFAMEKGGRLHMCSRKGCNSHFMDFPNVSDALRKMYNEYGYF